MGIDLSLTSKLPRKGLSRQSPAALLQAASDAVQELASGQLQGLQLVEDNDAQALFLRFHPTADDVGLTVADGSVTLQARTSGTGPGYHRFLVDLAERLGERLGLKWTAEDETEYFATRDAAKLEEHMLGFISQLCRAMLRQAKPGDTSPLLITMPLGPGFPQFKHDAFALTPLGPRSREWFETVAADPTKGRDFFSWWSQEPSARDRRDEAVAHMWMEVRWCEPRAEDEAFTIDRVLDLLEQAHGEEPALDMPWREWAELLEIARPDDPVLPAVRARAAKATGPLIGYRRAEWLDYWLPGGWRVAVPGSFSVTFEDDATWVAFDDTRTIRVSSLTAAKNAGAPGPEELRAGAPDGVQWVERSVEGGSAGGFFDEVEEDGRRYTNFTGHILRDADGHIQLGLITIAFDNRDDRAWALGVWESFTPPAEPRDGPEGAEDRGEA